VINIRFANLFIRLISQEWEAVLWDLVQPCSNWV